MKKSRAADALRFIRDHPGYWPESMSRGINLQEVDADGLKNPVMSPINRLYRAGYVVGWLHGAGLIRIVFRRRKIPRGTAMLRITRAGLGFLKENGPKKKRRIE
ncbi:MAG: hypothetical protein A2Y86_05210 [Candidatus Aminicenantes bacterium RBG_13_62_12]|nr:MAG: hypothetical protein A2Y86_05210 [Candidatus Aminicenantes bacterium RBG_13_62_12]